MSRNISYGELPQDFADSRERLLEAFAGENLEGLDTERIDAFFADRDLHIKPYIVVTPADFGDLKALDGLNVLDDIYIKGFEGTYSTYLDLSVVCRNPDLEVLNGTAYTEGLIIHEGAHSAFELLSFRRKFSTQKYSSNRTGFVTWGNRHEAGAFIEEGFVDFHRGEYMAENFKAGSLDGLKSVTSWEGSPHDLLNITPGFDPLYLPFKYGKVDLEGKRTAIISSLAGYAFELMVNSNPELLPAAYRSRTDEEGMNIISDMLGAQSLDWLYGYKYQQDDFEAGLDLVKSRVAEPN